MTFFKKEGYDFSEANKSVYLYIWILRFNSALLGLIFHHNKGTDIRTHNWGALPSRHNRAAYFTDEMLNKK